MAKKTTTKNAGTPTESHTRNLQRLQRTGNDVCDRINDHPTRSLRVRLQRARSVSPAIKAKVIAAIREALDECEASLEVAPEAERGSRLDLSNA